MRPLCHRLILCAAFAGGAIALPVGGADDPKKAVETKPAAPTPVDWSKFATVDPISGEIIKADETGVTLRVLAPSVPTSRKSRVPQQAKHIDYDWKYADGGLVRWKKLPPKLDSDLKKVPHTEKELAASKMPQGAPGYAAERTDLKLGHLVELRLVRPKSIPESKAKPEDLLVKYAIILGEDPTPPKAPKTDEPKKKKQ